MKVEWGIGGGRDSLRYASNRFLGMIETSRTPEEREHAEVFPDRITSLRLIHSHSLFRRTYASSHTQTVGVGIPVDTKLLGALKCDDPDLLP